MCLALLGVVVTAVRKTHVDLGFMEFLLEGKSLKAPMIPNSLICV